MIKMFKTKNHASSYIYNKAGQIYPRQVTENFNFPFSFIE